MLTDDRLICGVVLIVDGIMLIILFINYRGVSCYTLVLFTDKNVCSCMRRNNTNVN